MTMAAAMRSTTARARAARLSIVTFCLGIFAASTTAAFQPAARSRRRPRPGLLPSSPPSTTTALLASRKGNRGLKNKRPVSANTAKRSRPQVNDVLDGISSPPSFPHSVDPSDVPPGPPEDDPLAPLVRTIVRAADARKALDVAALRVTSCTSLTNFVIVASGTSRPQNQAIAAAVARDVAEAHGGRRCLGKGVPEGTADSGWILLDFGEVMVHVMTPKSRLFYDLDGQWRGRGGEEMDLSDVLVDEVGGGGPSEGDAAEDGKKEEAASMKERLDVEKEIDPFWS